MKRLTIVAIMLILIAIAFVVPVKATGFEVGQDIEPYPQYTKTLDCDDMALYTYLYLINAGYEPDIMYGDVGKTWHVWIEVTDNGTLWTYEQGMAIPGEFFEFAQYARRINYTNLLTFAKMDLR